eukprot:752496-Hanusia_phi.AAC.1
MISSASNSMALLSRPAACTSIVSGKDDRHSVGPHLVGLEVPWQILRKAVLPSPSQHLEEERGPGSGRTKWTRKTEPRKDIREIRRERSGRGCEGSEREN